MQQLTSAPVRAHQLARTATYGLPVASDMVYGIGSIRCFRGSQGCRDVTVRMQTYSIKCIHSRRLKCTAQIARTLPSVISPDRRPNAKTSAESASAAPSNIITIAILTIIITIITSITNPSLVAPAGVHADQEPAYIYIYI